MRKRVFLVVLVLAVIAVAGCAQKLAVGSSPATIDGVVSASEYSLSLPLGQMTVYLNRTADTLDMAITAPTTGWVAVGYGSDRMDGGSLFLGAVKDGKATLSEQMGMGHGHTDVGVTSMPEVSYAAKEEGGSTALEIAFKASDVISTNQSELMILAAYGISDNFFSYHSARNRATVKLQ
jgi:hypothetical protein